MSAQETIKAIQHEIETKEKEISRMRIEQQTKQAQLEELMREMTKLLEEVETLRERKEVAEKQHEIEEQVKKEYEDEIGNLRKIITEKTTDAEKLALITIFPQWEAGKTYTRGEYLQYQGSLYRVNQVHQSQEIYKPDSVASLYTKVTPPNAIGEWKQPTSAEDAYQKGDQVHYHGVIYRSLIDANTTTPGTDERFWKAEGEVEA